MPSCWDISPPQLEMPRPGPVSHSVPRIYNLSLHIIIKKKRDILFIRGETDRNNHMVSPSSLCPHMAFLLYRVYPNSQPITSGVSRVMTQIKAML